MSVSDDSASHGICSSGSYHDAHNFGSFEGAAFHADENPTDLMIRSSLSRLREQRHAVEALKAQLKQQTERGLQLESSQREARREVAQLRAALASQQAAAAKVCLAPGGSNLRLRLLSHISDPRTSAAFLLIPHDS